MSQQEVIAEFPKNARERVRVAISDYRGHTCVSVWVFYQGDDEKWYPTRKGISLDVESFSELAEAIRKAEQVIAGSADRDSEAQETIQ